jgi:hypothetical protein
VSIFVRSSLPESGSRSTKQVLYLPPVRLNQD